jgi:hypothetical protein
LEFAWCAPINVNVKHTSIIVQSPFTLTIYITIHITDSFIHSFIQCTEDGMFQPRFPPAPAAFENAWRAYYTEMDALAARMLGAFGR